MTELIWPADPWVDPVHVTTSDGTALAVRLLAGDQHRFVLVHGLASNALLWRDVADQLHRRGHSVAVVDLRGHGRSDRPDGGHTTAQAAADLRDVLVALGWQDDRPLVAGQSWGGNVVLRAAHDDPRWGAVAAVDGGWIHLGRRFASFEECWAELAPPDLSGRDPGDVLGWIGTMVADWPAGALDAIAGNLELVDGQVRNRLTRQHHRSILRSLWADDPADLYPAIAAPVHLIVAGSTTSVDAEQAHRSLPDATVSWHPDAHHDIHLQQPHVVLEHLLELATRMKGSGS
jgi:pimeloyl-ACP methyl ester carboxylesterase